MTNAKTVARRRTSIARSSAESTPVGKAATKKTPARHVADPATFPEAYSLRVAGDCMEPGIKHGAIAQFSTKETYGPGDIVCIWFQPDTAAKMGAPCALKRLRLALPPWVKGFPYKDHPNSDVAAIVVFESDNQRRTYSVKCSDVVAIHKFTGCQ